MKIRPAVNTDRPEIEALIFPILRSYGLTPDPETTDADLKDIETTYSKNGGIFDVLLGENGENCGNGSPAQRLR